MCSSAYDWPLIDPRNIIKLTAGLEWLTGRIWTILPALEALFFSHTAGRFLDNTSGHAQQRLSKGHESECKHKKMDSEKRKGGAEKAENKKKSITVELSRMRQTLGLFYHDMETENTT